MPPGTLWERVPTSMLLCQLLRPFLLRPVASGHSSPTVTAVALGNAAVTLTAADGHGGTTADTFAGTVKDTPAAASVLADASGPEAGAVRDVSLACLLIDTNGDNLTITAVSSNCAAVSM